MEVVEDLFLLVYVLFVGLIVFRLLMMRIKGVGGGVFYRYTNNPAFIRRWQMLITNNIRDVASRKVDDKAKLSALATAND